MTYKFLCKQTIAIIIIGLAIRYIVGFFLTYTYDTHSWVLIISNFESGQGLYEIAGFNYAPVWGYILGTFSLVTESLGLGFVGERVTEGLIMESQSGWFLSAYAPSMTFIIAFKTMIYLIDIAVGYVIYRFVIDRYRDNKKGIMGFSIWFLCPFVIAVGAIGGMFDALSALMVMICIYWVLNNKYFGAGLMLGIATMMKLFPGVIVPILIVYIIHKHRSEHTVLKNICLAATGFLLISLIILMPSIIDGHIADCFGFITNRASSSMGLGLGSIERYGTVLAYMAIVVLILLLSFRCYKKGLVENQLMPTVLLCLAILFLFPATPQYMLLMTPILIVCAIGNKQLLKPLIVLSVGTTLFAASMNVANLLSLAAFTDIISLETFETWFMIIFNNSGLTLTSIMYYGGAIIQYAGILYLLILCVRNRNCNKPSVQ